MTLYQDGVDEQESMGRTTSRSEIRVRAYKRGNADIACTVSKALYSPEPKYPKKEFKEDCEHLVDISNKLNVRVPEKLKTGGSSTCLFNNCTFILY